MKKLVSAVLAASMVMSLAACTDSSSKKHGKNGKISQLPTEETEDTSETEGTKETTENTEPTETTEDTTPAPTMAPSNQLVEDKLVYDPSYESLNIEKASMSLGYGLIDPVKDFGDMPVRASAVRVECDYLFTDIDGYSDMVDLIDLEYDAILTDYEDQYIRELTKFLDDAGAGIELQDKFISSFTYVARADSFITSFYRTASDTNKHAYASYNYLTEEATKIEFEDVVKDKDVLCKYLEMTVDGYSDLSEIEEAIMDGTVPFVMTYDGIILIWTYINYKISAIDCKDAFNQGFFGKTPQDFVLQSDFQNKIYWDIDGDGYDDVFSVEEIDSADIYACDFEKLILRVNSDATEFTHDYSTDFYGDLEDVVLACYGGTYYLLVELTIEDDYSIQNVFELNADNTFTYLGSRFGYFRDIPYDPGNLVLVDVFDICGTSAWFNQFELLGQEGLFTPLDTLYERIGNVLVTKKELQVDEIGGDTITLPAGSALIPLGFSYANNIVYFEVCAEDPEDAVWVYVSVSPSGQYPILIGGIDQDDLFVNLFYAG